MWRTFDQGHRLHPERPTDAGFGWVGQQRRGRKQRHPSDDFKARARRKLRLRDPPRRRAFLQGGRNGREDLRHGIRNCVGLAVHPTTGDAYCSTNERDGFGDDLVPDYVTRVREGAFYGWPWFYIGNHEDPRHAGERPDLKDKVTVPDVLIQAHSASLGLTFYNASAFPAEYHGDGFAAEHGSWNRAKRTGYKVIRIRMKDGVPTGEYQDFMTGFVAGDFRRVGTTRWRHGHARRRAPGLETERRDLAHPNTSARTATRNIPCR